MSFERLRVYDAGRFHEVDLPDWYHEANRLIEVERIDWHRALERVLDCEHTLLTEEGLLGGALEIRFWPSEIHGIFMLIETPLSLVEQIVVPNPADWLPFLSRHLAPLIAVANQSSLIALHGRIGNAFIAWARHGKGSHIGRETGESRIDLDNDRDRRRAQQARAAMERERREGRT
ncbi:hypothetical protein [Roseovarius sp. D22-M7]|uniref:hypothetical protein n=1 Tax=Roseovarius sp. D22-M7 TaxID=3127116 RepID=UPI00301030BE